MAGGAIGGEVFNTPQRLTGSRRNQSNDYRGQDEAIGFGFGKGGARWVALVRRKTRTMMMIMAMALSPPLKTRNVDLGSL